MSQLTQIFLLFADLLDYPNGELLQRVNECAPLLADTCPDATENLAAFGDLIAQTPLNQAREVYTYTFDLQGVCPPYVGYHLFGETYKRSWFMAGLNQGYAGKCYVPMNELPDHVTVVLRYLAQGYEDEFSQGLLYEGLQPALEQMLKLLHEKDANPYRKVISALALILGEEHLAYPVQSMGEEEGGLANG